MKMKSSWLPTNIGARWGQVFVPNRQTVVSLTNAGYHMGGVQNTHADAPARSTPRLQMRAAGLVQQSLTFVNRAQECAAAAVEDAAGVVMATDEEDGTVISIKNADGGNMLMEITGVFSKFDVSVLEASISTDDNGEIVDIFRIATPDNKPVRATMYLARH